MGRRSVSWKPLTGARLPTVALNILYGAALLTRVNILRCQGIDLPENALHIGPLEDTQIKE